MNDLTPEERDAPIYSTFSELNEKGFSLDTGTWVFVLGIHIAAVALGIWAVAAAPQDWAYIAGIWCITQFVLGSLSTTLYSHRLITHNATRQVSLPVHLFFCVFGQILSVQGSVRRWSANHVLHHGVDRHGKKELDPYSATWFPDSLRNFLWTQTWQKKIRLWRSHQNACPQRNSLPSWRWRADPEVRCTRALQGTRPAKRQRPSASLASQVVP